MASEADLAPRSTPKLSYFSLPPNKLSEHPGMLTPPLRPPASIPFYWEEAPGRPRTCTTTTSSPTISNKATRSLELPPRLLPDAKLTNVPSPTTVFEGPYVVDRSASYSLSFSRGRKNSFGCPDERGGRKMGQSKERGSFRSWVGRGLKGNRRVAEDSFVTSPSCSSSSTSCSTYSSSGEGSADHSENTTKVKITRMRRSSSLSSLSLSRTKSHFWATIKQVVPVPWKNNRKMKKSDGPKI